MDKNKRHITEITRRDIEEIADAANMQPGVGIDIQRTADGLEISIDRGQLARWVKTIIQGGNI